MPFKGNNVQQHNVGLYLSISPTFFKVWGSKGDAETGTGGYSNVGRKCQNGGEVLMRTDGARRGSGRTFAFKWKFRAVIMAAMVTPR